jgi:hypothetical protein
MASMNDQTSTMEDLLKQMNKRLITLERRRNGDGVAIDGNCVNGGGSGGDTSYYGGGTNYPTGSYPPGGWAGGGGGGGTYTAGANIAIASSTIHFEVVFTEPGSPRIGQLWFDDTA